MGGGKTRRRNKSFSWKNAAMRHEGFGERGGGGRGSWNGILVRPYDMLPLYHNVWELQHSFFCEFLQVKPWSCSFPFAVGSGIERGGRRYYCLSSFLLLCLLVWENGGIARKEESRHVNDQELDGKSRAATLVPLLKKKYIPVECSYPQFCCHHRLVVFPRRMFHLWAATLSFGTVLTLQQYSIPVYKCLPLLSRKGGSHDMTPTRRALENNQEEKEE